MTEDEVQISIVEWCGDALKADVVFWSVPNERQPKHMSNLIAKGLKPGVADLQFMKDGKSIFIEVKRPTTYKRGKRRQLIIDQRGGTLSTDQEVFKNAVIAAGASYYTVDNLLDFIDSY